jgi:hypothetical protein
MYIIKAVVGRWEGKTRKSYRKMFGLDLMAVRDGTRVIRA